MLDDLDETIRQVLIQAGGFHPEEVEISFDTPNREWSQQIARPTINCYLFDVHERRALREEGWRVEQHGRPDASRRPPPLFYEITYLITSWTAKMDDQHRLLWEVLETLALFPVLNDREVYIDADVAGAGEGSLPITACLAGVLVDYPFPITTTVAQLEGVLRSPGEFWTALDNQLRPSLSYVVTLALDRRSRRAGKPVHPTGVRIRVHEARAEDGFRVDQVFRVPPGVSPAGVTITAVEHAAAMQADGQAAVAHAATVQSDAQGMFYLRDLPPGRYLVAATFGGQTSTQLVLLRDASIGDLAILSDLVRDQDAQPLADIRVEIADTDLSTITDAHGRFTFQVRPGRYVLRFLFDGWVQQRSVIVRSSGHRLTLGYGGY